jgi:aryl-alcohol dehydrogenase-like predicted oxidoreductase
VGARDSGQLDGSLAAVDVRLAADDLRELERLFPA